MILVVGTHQRIGQIIVVGTFVSSVFLPLSFPNNMVLHVVYIKVVIGIAVNCVWGYWRFGPCSRSCGSGYQQATRVHLFPARYKFVMLLLIIRSG